MTRDEIEKALVVMMQMPEWSKVLTEYNQLLTMIGNVEGDECLGLALLAVGNCARRDGYPL